MARLLAPAVGLFGLGLLLSAGCSGSSFSESGGGGTRPTAGTSSAGSEPGGGSSSGGSASGGSSSGGSASGGSASGGSASGGSESGGSASGGTGTGGSGTSGSGGSTNVAECRQASDCVQCQYSGTPTQAADCCTGCNYKPMSKHDCEENKAVYEKFCANLHPLCPAIACVQPPEALCQDGMCVSGKAP